MKRIVFAVLVGSVFAFAAACGSSSSSASCCLNGLAYSCPSTTAASSCLNGDVSGCTRNPSKDAVDGGLSCQQ